jgi:hypothetical protein
MTFVNVVGSDPGSSAFKNVLSTLTSDTTSQTAARPADTPSEPSVGVQTQAGSVTHVSGQDQTAGGGTSGPPTAWT